VFDALVESNHHDQSNQSQRVESQKCSDDDEDGFLLNFESENVFLLKYVLELCKSFFQSKHFL
jgi:hypothetical protein